MSYQYGLHKCEKYSPDSLSWAAYTVVGRQMELAAFKVQGSPHNERGPISRKAARPHSLFTCATFTAVYERICRIVGNQQPIDKAQPLHRKALSYRVHHDGKG
jgi:hypothetical protein